MSAAFDSIRPVNAPPASDGTDLPPHDPRPLAERCEAHAARGAGLVEAARQRIRSQLALIRALQADGRDTAAARAILQHQRTLVAAQRGHVAAFRRLVATYQVRVGRPRFPALAIVLYRNDNRALLLPRGEPLAACPAPVRQWLGTPTSAVPAELTADTPMPGIAASRVRDDLLRQGYCALDMYGVVRTFEDAER